jgi:hypothetical protein
MEKRLPPSAVSKRVETARCQAGSPIARRLARVCEGVAWGVGIVAAVTYFGLRVESKAAMHAGLDAFAAARAAIPAAAAADVSADPRMGTGHTNVVDQSLWSPKRSAAHVDASGTFTDVPLGVMRIPARAIEVPIYPGTGDGSLDRGAGHITGTAELRIRRR